MQKIQKVRLGAQINEILVNYNELINYPEITIRLNKIKTSIKLIIKLTINHHKY
jgi:hypothetical protein